MRHIEHVYVSGDTVECSLYMCTLAISLRCQGNKRVHVHMYRTFNVTYTVFRLFNLFFVFILHLREGYTCTHIIYASE